MDELFHDEFDSIFGTMAQRYLRCRHHKNEILKKCKELVKKYPDNVSILKELLVDQTINIDANSHQPGAKALMTKQKMLDAISSQGQSLPPSQLFVAGQQCKTDVCVLTREEQDIIASLKAF